MFINVEKVLYCWMGVYSWPQRLRGSSVAVQCYKKGEGKKRRNGLDASIVSLFVFKLNIYFGRLSENFFKIGIV